MLAALLERRGRAIAKSTLHAWVADAARRAKTPLEVSAELAPAWGGVLGLDGKSVYAAGKRWTLLLATDHLTQDVVHALLVAWETKEAFVQLITEAVAVAHYPLRGVVSDMRQGFARAHHDHFGKVPFQACRVHFDRRLREDIRVRRTSPTVPIREELRERIRQILYAQTEPEARRRFETLTAEAGRYRGLMEKQDTLKSLRRHWGLYMAHHLEPGLPADNNVTENIIKQLGKKLRLMEGFGTPRAAEQFCRLLIGCYRFKRFSDSSRNGGNGKAPLELAGVGLHGRDWLEFLLDR